SAALNPGNGRDAPGRPEAPGNSPQYPNSPGNSGNAPGQTGTAGRPDNLPPDGGAAPGQGEGGTAVDSPGSGVGAARSFHWEVESLSNDPVPTFNSTAKKTQISRALPGTFRFTGVLEDTFGPSSRREEHRASVEVRIYKPEWKSSSNVIVEGLREIYCIAPASEDTPHYLYLELKGRAAGHRFEAQWTMGRITWRRNARPTIVGFTFEQDGSGIPIPGLGPNVTLPFDPRTPGRETLAVFDDDKEAIDLLRDPEKRDPVLRRATTVAQVRIQPAQGNRGINGDIVPSNLGAAGEEHYVSPRAAGGFVTLEATVEPAGLAFESNFVWDGGDPVQGQPMQRQVSRAAAAHVPVSVREQPGGDRCALMNVWIVWCGFDPNQQHHDTFAPDTAQAGNPLQTYVRPATHCYRFIAQIAPAEIITGADRPALDGQSTQRLPQNEGNAAGVEHRWDVSRRRRIRVVASANHGFTDADLNWPQFGDLPTGMSIATDPMEDYPATPLHGNDDAGANDEDNDPYSANHALPNCDDTPPVAGDPGSVFPAVGEVGSFDRPSSPWVRQAAGNAGDTIVFRTHFQEFVRLQIGDTANGNNWYVVSDPFLWKVETRFIRRDHGVEDNQSSTALDNDNF
ncbi:MAG: hypothetical protein HY719_09655, partial [Planctomycetes bacterium]|nr:hypothetical protein [Planctomycetota bacterium]